EHGSCVGSFFFQAEDGIRGFSRDWSSDVCSSDLCSSPCNSTLMSVAICQPSDDSHQSASAEQKQRPSRSRCRVSNRISGTSSREIGRASCRGRVEERVVGGGRQKKGRSGHTELVA